YSSGNRAGGDRRDGDHFHFGVDLCAGRGVPPELRDVLLRGALCSAFDVYVSATATPADGAAYGTSSGLVPIRSAVLDPDRRAFKAESFADLVFQKTLIREVKLHCAISEQDKGGRGSRRLGHVLNTDALGG